MRSKRLARLVVASLTLALMIVFAPYAHASPAGAPGDNSATGSTSPTTSGAQAVSPDPTWLAAKNAFRVRSGVLPHQSKGTASHPYILSSQPQTVCCGGGPPASAMLETTNPSNIGTGVWEPSNGLNPNFGSGTSHNDDAGTPYGGSTGNTDFFRMCGPGAADVALWYWPAPFNALPSNTVTDHGVTTTWKSERWRAYMTQLAWQIQWPGWLHPGMQDQTIYPSAGTTLYGMQGGLNWEASGENPNTWLNYFYVIVWNNAQEQPSDQANFHSRVVSDIASSSVPVVAEVNANMLPNWQRTGMNRHYITILGYDDTAGTYTYTDTCGKSTNCGDQTHGSDGGLHTADQTTLWKAIQNIPPTPFPNDPAQGDGGYIW